MKRWTAYLKNLCLVSLVMVLCWTGSAQANMPSPGWLEGDRAAIPLTTLSPAEILHETLTFDLTPLDSSQPGSVSATYQIRNPNPPAAADFLFISSGISSGRVTVNQSPVIVRPVRGEEVSPKFRDAVKRYAQPTDNPSEPYLQFRAMLPKGDFPIQVHYRVRPSIYDGFSVYRQYQVQYALAPARDWQQFGTLDVSIKLPPGWQGSANPEMALAGDTLSGSFTGIPADRLIIDLQPQGSKAAEQRYNGLLIAGLAIAVLLSIAVGWWLGRFSKRRLVWCRDRPRFWTTLGWLSLLTLVILLLPLCPVIFWLVLSVTNLLGRLGLPSQHISPLWNAESGRIWIALILGSLTAIIAAISFAIAAVTLKANPQKY
jgi:hypothetical protein